MTCIENQEKYNYINDVNAFYPLSATKTDATEDIKYKDIPKFNLP